MPEHKHASVLRAIADGVPLSEFEYRHNSWKDGEWSANSLSALLNFLLSEDHNERYEFRRKPQHIIVNGFKVPKPLDADHKAMTVHVPRPDAFGYFDTYSEYGCRNAMQRGIAHASIDAAIAHAKAMLGIDPKWEE